MKEFDVTPEVRLVAQDPAAGASYVHADGPAMLSRVMATPRVAKVTFAHGFRLKMGSAAAAAALVTVGGIATLQAAVPSLSVLALGASHPAKIGADSLSASTVPGSFMPVRFFSNLQFQAGPDLTASASSAPTYVVSLPGDLAAASAQIATALGVSGDPSSAPAANSSWTVSDGTNSIYFSTDSGSLFWSYSATSAVVSSGGTGTSSSPGTTVPPTKSDSSTVSTLSDPQTLALAQGLLSQLGVSGPFGTPTFNDTSDPSATTGEPWVSLSWEPTGVESGFSFGFTFDAQGTLLYANGVNAVVSAGPAYPIMSEVDGVAALQSQQNSYRGGPILSTPPVASSPTCVPSTTVSPDGTTVTASACPPDTSTTSPGPSSDPSTTTTAPPTIVVLDTVTIQYQQNTLADGTVVLLPQYVYTADDGSTYYVLAIPSQYVNLSSGSGVTPMMY